MRKVPDKSILQASAVAEAKKAGLDAERILSQQEEQSSGQLPYAGGRAETKMPMPVREPIWYRHWGLNE